MKKVYLLLLMLVVLAGCGLVNQEVHYVAKSSHWKAVYHSNTGDGLMLIYLDDGQEVGDIQIKIEGKKEALSISDARVNEEGKIIIQKKDVKKIFNEDTTPTIQIQWQGQEETLVVQ
ncbi:hypothetical protein AEA09_07440 [Lysinibacillus contaminans]|uniref:Lipoprotein n=1 Tax=Lysinibacillus contaminans TaxID=1293441 RepID=A0ABR5K0F7_9BACI|nr:hypothetical protein [Lysinibacillus contaminans]KOS68405.1 hypothetical protein AEA09_07440 [Lysinibacillus contaminans]